eukprot:c29314_g1_i2 orf=372-4238(-)
MFTSPKRSWPGWFLSSSTEKKDEGKELLPEIRTPGSNDVSPLKGLIQSSPVTSLEDNGRLIVRYEPEIWRRFRDTEDLDGNLAEKKDRAALLVHISSLHSELYDYQYNMGLLLMEQKEWESRSEKLKVTLQEADENLKREVAARLIAISEFEKREEAQKNALAVEKQCVADLEKTLKEMRAEAAELKVTAGNKLAQARDLVATTEEKSILAESKLHAAEAREAEASRKQADADRKLQEVEAREDALRRERHSFKAEQEAHESELKSEKQNLCEWEKKLQEGQERLCEGQRLLNQREEYSNQRDDTLQQISKELLDARKQIEKEHTVLKRSEADLNARLASLMAREENAVNQEISIVKKEQEVLVLQEKLANRERTVEMHEQDVKDIEALAMKERDRLEVLERELKQKEDTFLSLEVKKTECEAAIAEMDKHHCTILAEREEVENNRVMVESREAEIDAKEEKLMKREQQLENRAEKAKEKEKDLDSRIKAVKEKERFLKNEEKQLEGERKMIAEEREDVKHLKEDMENCKKELDGEKKQIEKEREKLKVTEQEREDLLNMQKCLKEEIDECRERTKAVSMEAEELNVEKERFEKEWDILDEKRELIKRELDQVELEKKRMARWLQDEKGRLKEEKQALREQMARDSEAIYRERVSFVKSMESERAEWFAKVEKQKEDLLRDTDARRREQEGDLEKRKKDFERQLKDTELRLKRESEREKEYINALRASVEKEIQEVEQERQKLEKERKETAKHREESERECIEIRKDIEELQAQRERLKEQRESLRRERDAFLQEADRLKKLREELKVMQNGFSSEHQLPEKNDAEVVSPKLGSSNHNLEKEAVHEKVHVSQMGNGIKSPVGLTLEKSSGTPSRLSWLQRCASVLFLTPERRLGTANNRDISGEQKISMENLKFAETKPQAAGNTGHEKQVQNNPQGEEHEGVPIQQSIPDDSFGLDHSAEIANNQQSGHRWNGMGFRRTHSILATVEDAKAILGSHLEGEDNGDKLPNGIGEGNSEKFHNVNREEDRVAPIHDKESDTKDGDSIAQEVTENNKHSSQERKRPHQPQLMDGLIEQVTNMVETVPEVATGGRKRRRQQDGGGMKDDLWKETPRAMRYNLRHSTIATKINVLGGETGKVAQEGDETAVVLHEVPLSESPDVASVEPVIEPQSEVVGLDANGGDEIEQPSEEIKRHEVADAFVSVDLPLSDGNSTLGKCDPAEEIASDVLFQMDKEGSGGKVDSAKEVEALGENASEEGGHDDDVEDVDVEGNLEVQKQTLTGRLWNFLTS